MSKEKEKEKEKDKAMRPIKSCLGIFAIACALICTSAFATLADDFVSEMVVAIEAYVGVVVESLPAFYANVLIGDVLIAIDGVQVRNVVHALKLMDEIDVNGMSPVFSVIRNGKEKNILVEF
jgi:S1-C subfamily serine protease